MSKAKPATDTPPSADALQQLERLLVGRLTPESIATGWRLITAAQANPDFFVVLDYAQEKGFVVPCGVDDPKRQPNPTWTNPLDGSEMVWIPPGKCRLGPDTEPVTLDGFSLAKYPVTNELFASFVTQAKYTSLEPAVLTDEDDAEDEYANGEFLAHWSNGRPPRRKDHPVVFVSYLDALAYCEWAGLSVPGEYQWEKAARGTDGRAFPWGTDGYHHGRRRLLAQVEKRDTTGVAEFADIRTAFGCEQMAGNVSTWCQTGNPKKMAAPVAVWPMVKLSPNVVAPEASVRGGAFKRYGSKTLRAAHRRKLSVLRRNDWVGIRPACLLPVRPAAV